MFTSVASAALCAVCCNIYSLLWTSKCTSKHHYRGNNMYSITCYGDWIRYQQGRVQRRKRRRRRNACCVRLAETKNSNPIRTLFPVSSLPTLKKKDSLWLQFGRLVSSISSLCVQSFLKRTLNPVVFLLVQTLNHKNAQMHIPELIYLTFYAHFKAPADLPVRSRSWETWSEVNKVWKRKTCQDCRARAGFYEWKFFFLTFPLSLFVNEKQLENPV